MSPAPAAAPLPDPADLLPHAPPMLLVDRLTALDPGEHAAGEWSTGREPLWRVEEAPGATVIARVLLLEALAQVGACAVFAVDFYRDKQPMFGGADRVTFDRPVVPGETVALAMWTKVLGSRFGRAAGFATVGGDRVCEAEITFVITNWKE
jgi:3-hydroxyacyl-[acyl-carrier-protein] dehydratase